MTLVTVSNVPTTTVSTIVAHDTATVSTTTTTTQHKTTMHHLPTILASHLQNQTAAKTEPNYYPSI